MPQKLIRRGFYRHYKGGLYEVTDNALDTETEVATVIYRGVSHSNRGQIFVRPAAMFGESVGKEPRFKFLGLTAEEALVVLGERLAEFSGFSDSVVENLKEELATVREQEEIASGIIARGMDALVAAGVVERFEHDAPRQFSGVPNVGGVPTDAGDD